VNRINLTMCLALLALVLGTGACSVVAGSKCDLISGSYMETGMLNPVVAVGERPESVPQGVVVTAPALRLEINETAFRLVVPWLVDIEVSDLGPKTRFLN
jgi:hypothetical protein